MFVHIKCCTFALKLEKAPSYPPKEGEEKVIIQNDKISKRQNNKYGRSY